jgi:hypothetical protein
MTILHLATNTMIQTRMTVVSGYKQTFSTVTAELPGTLQPAGVNDADKSLGDGVFGRQFVFFCDGTVDIQEGDRLKDTVTGEFYRVRAGGAVRRSFGSIDYLKVICERI